ncbi:MAG TPA: permease [Syntrophomonas sp.]|jgi:hypothetical protein|nr:permease [Syntrophomonas sp.]
MPNYLLYIAIGTIAGLLCGFFGLGGGFVIVPALIFLAGFDQITAQGTSLAIMLPPVGLLAFMEYYKTGNVNIKAGLIICVTLFLTAFIGAKLAHYVSPAVLRKAFGVLLMLIAVKMLMGK